MTVDLGDHEVNRIDTNDMKSPRFNKGIIKRKDLLDHLKKDMGHIRGDLIKFSHHHQMCYAEEGTVKKRRLLHFPLCLPILVDSLDIL